MTGIAVAWSAMAGLLNGPPAVVGLCGNKHSGLGAGWSGPKVLLVGDTRSDLRACRDAAPGGCHTMSPLPRGSAAEVTGSGATTSWTCPDQHSPCRADRLRLVRSRTGS